MLSANAGLEDSVETGCELLGVLPAVIDNQTFGSLLLTTFGLFTNSESILPGATAYLLIGGVFGLVFSSFLCVLITLYSRDITHLLKHERRKFPGCISDPRECNLYRF